MQELYIADFNGDTQLFVIVGSFLSYFKSLEKVFYYSLGAESRKKSYAKHFEYKLATGVRLKKNKF